MIIVPGKQWTHTTAKSIADHGREVGVDLFDSESIDGDNFVEVYIRFVDGKRWPARTINMTGDPEAAKRCLDSWCRKGSVNDYRKTT